MGYPILRRLFRQGSWHGHFARRLNKPQKTGWETTADMLPRQVGHISLPPMVGNLECGGRAKRRHRFGSARSAPSTRVQSRSFGVGSGPLRGKPKRRRRCALPAHSKLKASEVARKPPAVAILLCPGAGAELAPTRAGGAVPRDVGVPCLGLRYTGRTPVLHAANQIPAIADSARFANTFARCRRYSSLAKVSPINSTPAAAFSEAARIASSLIACPSRACSIP